MHANEAVCVQIPHYDTESYFKMGDFSREASLISPPVFSLHLPSLRGLN